VIIANNTITSGSTISSSPAVFIGGSAENAVITDNLIQSTATSASGYLGIVVSSKGAKVLRNRVYGGNPLVLQGAVGAVVENNTLWGTIGAGITVLDEHPGTHWTGIAEGRTSGSITLDATPTSQDGGSSAAASTVDNAYNGYWISIVSGTGAGQTRRIKLASGSYTGSTRVALIGADDGVSTFNWVTTPSTDSVYRIITPSDNNVIRNNIFVGSGTGIPALLIPEYHCPRSSILDNNIYWGDSNGIPAKIVGESLTSLSGILSRWQSEVAWTTDPWGLIPAECIVRLNDLESVVVDPGLRLTGGESDSWKPNKRAESMGTGSGHVGAAERKASGGLYINPPLR